MVFLFTRGSSLFGQSSSLFSGGHKLTNNDTGIFKRDKGPIGIPDDPLDDDPLT